VRAPCRGTLDRWAAPGSARAGLTTLPDDATRAWKRARPGSAPRAPSVSGVHIVGRGCVLERIGIRPACSPTIWPCIVTKTHPKGGFDWRHQRHLTQRGKAGLPRLVQGMMCAMLNPRPTAFGQPSTVSLLTRSAAAFTALSPDLVKLSA
jgi:hypothetical protein